MVPGRWVRSFAARGGGEPVLSKTSGTRVLYLFGAMYSNEQHPPEVWVRALCDVIDRALPRESPDKVTILIDARAGSTPDFSNPVVTKLLPFVKLAGSVMGLNFPERVEQFVIFPVPWIARFFWAMAKPFIDSRTRNKVLLIGGDANVGAPVPDGVAQFVDPGCG